MPGRNSSAPGSKGRGTTTRTSRKRAARQRAFRELLEHASGAGINISLGISTADALQECLDRAVALFRFAASKVDELPEDDIFEIQVGPNGATSIVPNRWRIFEDAARAEIERLAATMTGLGIAERKVRIEEAQAALLVASIRDAAVEAGISHDQVRLLGEALRRRVEKPIDVAPSPASSGVGASQNPETARQVATLGPGHGNH